jgi:hypothetical protein
MSTAAVVLRAKILAQAVAAHRGHLKAVLPLDLAGGMHQAGRIGKQHGTLL